MTIQRFLLTIVMLILPSLSQGSVDSMDVVDQLIQKNSQQDGLFVLDSGQHSLMSRAWLARHAEHSIDIQYFIWSTDNIGILAAEALLQAAQRGVQVRVIVDDLLVDADEHSLLALAAHPGVSIKIYNPQHSVGTSFLKRIKNVVTDFHGVNQRMHDKTMIVDGKVAITGGRNMADEYYDYDQAYNFRDRDVLVMGPVVAQMSASFDRFWQHPLAVSVSELLSAGQTLAESDVQQAYEELHAYAGDPRNFAPEVRRTIADLHHDFAEMSQDIVWTRARFISDQPGKNEQRSFDGGGESTRALVDVLSSAKRRVVIQSPYLVMPEGGLELFRSLVERGVSIAISTNSLASTDNLMAYSGYSKQRQALLDAGVDVYEFKPFPQIQQRIMHRFNIEHDQPPIFAIHAKTLVVDGETLFIGTFNLDPRSANLNTEVGILAADARLASQVEAAIREDMHSDNSWRVAEQIPDHHAGWGKRIKLWLYRLLPLEPVL